MSWSSKPHFWDKRFYPNIQIVTLVSMLLKTLKTEHGTFFRRRYTETQPRLNRNSTETQPLLSPSFSLAIPFLLPRYRLPQDSPKDCLNNDKRTNTRICIKINGIIWSYQIFYLNLQANHTNPLIARDDMVISFILK